MSVPLLTTKLEVPRTRLNIIPRPRLMEILDAGFQRSLTLISAPAGYGKTSTLCAWIAWHSMHKAWNAGSERRIAWLSLEEGDNDPIRFWSYVVATLQRLLPDLGRHTRVLRRAQIPESQRIEAMLAILLNEIAAFPDEFALVLDDYHVIETAAIHEGISFLLDHLPAQMHLSIASRADPPLPLARWRARDQLVEIRADDLRFTPDEAATFLNQSMGLNLSASDITALEARIEGWIAGLQLAALSMQGRTDVSDFIADFTGSHHYVIDYLTEEVLKRQPRQVQSFLLRTSILDELCGPLCDSVTGQQDTQVMLEYLEQANLFTIRLDDQRQWYRYHLLFAEVLRLRLRQAEPDQLPELHRRAATWYQDHQFIDDAVRHALAARDAAWAARLVEEHIDDVLRRGEGVTFRRWLAAIPQEVVRARPRLALAQALAALNVGRLEEVEPLLAAAERALASFPSDPDARSVSHEASALDNVPATIALLRASLAGFRGDPKRMSELARLALTDLSEDARGTRYSVRWNLALADWMSGRVHEAERTFAEIVAEGRAAGELHLTLSACENLGRVQRAQGQLGMALDTYEEGIAFAARGGSPLAPSVGIAHLGLADVFYERNQLERALHHATEGITLARRLTSTQSLANGLATLAWIQRGLGDSAAASEAMEEAYQVMPNQEIIALLNPVPTERTRLLLVEGDLKNAARWLQERGLSEGDQPSYIREREYLLMCRILLAQNKPDRALGLLERLGTRAEAEARNDSVIKTLLLKAIALNSMGDQSQSIPALTRALALAEPEGYIRIFLDEGTPMLRLLRQAESRGVAPDYLSQILGTFEKTAYRVTPTVPSLSEPLSERELEILRLVVAGLTTQEIAARLVIAVGTVRTHLKNIYGKLDVHSRLQAVERARALKLV